MSLFGGRTDGSGERTAEEREQARLEREARRRARAAGTEHQPRDYAVGGAHVRPSRRAGVIAAPQRRIRVEDPPPESWDDEPEVYDLPSVPETPTTSEPERYAFDSEPVVDEFEPQAIEPEPFVDEFEPQAVEPDEELSSELERYSVESEPFVEESDPRAVEPGELAVESERSAFESEPFLDEFEPRAVEPEELAFERESRSLEPEELAAESEALDPESLASDPDPPSVEDSEPFAFEPEPTDVDHEPFAFEFEPPPRDESEPGGPPLERPSSNGRSSAAGSEPLDLQPEAVLPVRDHPEGGAPAMQPAAPAPVIQPSDDAPPPVAQPLPPRLKRFRQERMVGGGAGRRATGRRRKSKATPAPRSQATPAPRSPRRVAQAAEERARPGVRGWIARALVPLVLVGVLSIGWFVVSYYQPFTGKGGERVRVKVPNGLTARDIGNLLADRGVVDSGFFFSLRARTEGNRDKLKAGTFNFRRDMSYLDAMAILVKGPPPIQTVTLTLPEGNTVRDFADAVDDSKKVKGSYMRAVKRARFNPARYGAPRGAPLEGFLFPATYEYRTGRGTAGDLVADQLQAFKRTMRGISMRPARRAGRTPYEVLIIASMVERETSVPRERKIIAGVIYNRLRQGIPLGIDATIRYATNNWKRPIRQSELDEPGPYNTRQNQDLPPTPIGNPGLASIKAAANPKRTPFLFFVVKPGGDGEHAFSRTDAEFQRDVQRYNTARDARGGRDPR